MFWLPSLFHFCKFWFFMELVNLIKFNIWQQRLSSSSTAVEYSTTDFEMVGLNLLLSIRRNGGDKKCLLLIPYLSHFYKLKKWIILSNLSIWLNLRFGQGKLKGEVSLYHWPPVWLVLIRLFYKYKQKLSVSSHTADSKPVKQEVNVQIDR